MRTPQIPLYAVHMPKGVPQALQAMLYSGQIASGPSNDEFVHQFQEYIGNPNIILTGDSSSSLCLSLYIAGVRPGDEVLASPMACLATNMPIKNLFADVRWCDVDPETGNIDPAKIGRQISPRSKALLIYHWAGNPADLGSIYSIAKEYHLPVIEDASEALGAKYRGCKIGSTGSDFTIFSFYPNKHITTGDGSAIAFARPQDCESGLWLRRFGIHQPSFRDDLCEINPTSDIPLPGFNTYMNNIAATLGLAQMPHLPSILARHQENGEFYDRALERVPGITVLKHLAGTESAYWVYTFLAEKRDDLLKHLRGRGVHASRVHARNDHYSCFGAERRRLAGVDYFDRRTLSIPCGWWVSPEDRAYIVDSISKGW